MNQQEQLEAIIGANMGCYYREATKQWLRQINDLHTKKYDHLEDMTAEVLGTTQAITALIQEARIEENVRLRRRYNGTNYEKLRATLNYRIEQLSGGSNNG